MMNLNLGAVGNCNIAMLIDDRARIVWGGYPRLDGDPIFAALLGGKDPYQPEDPDNGGYFAIELVGQERAEQAYLPNSAMLCTRLYAKDGGAVEIMDFAPRYERNQRLFRPPMIVRRLFPLAGRPRVRIRLRPRFGLGRFAPSISFGSNHVRYYSGTMALRLTTDVPIAYVTGETHFVLERPANLLFGADESLQTGIEETARLFQERTLDYWRNWARSLSIPFEWQDAVIRAAITLKLCNFEETGAIVAALTTSIPEAPGTRRNWDYRLCWPRDAYFVIQALNRLGATRTMEGYLGFMSNIVGGNGDRGLQPVYGITRMARLDEREIPDLAGYRGMGPVRVGNHAYRQIQNDVYGSVVMAATHSFFDRRLGRIGDLDEFERLEALGHRAVEVFDQPDAGPWELRNSADVHTFSSLMCWAACDRLAKIAGVLALSARQTYWKGEADRLRRAIEDHCWNAAENSFASTWGGNRIDASLLLLHDLGFLCGDDPRFIGTVDAVTRHLKRGDFVMRYSHADDFGLPETAFTICTFWYINALASIGRKEEARVLFEAVLARRNPLGLLSEDIHPETGELWGNFPQAYSMVGLINAAMRLSRTWEEAC